MARLIRTACITRHVLPDKTALAGFGGIFYTGLMPSQHRAEPAVRVVTPIRSSGLIPVGRYMPQRARSTLR